MEKHLLSFEPFLILVQASLAAEQGEVDGFVELGCSFCWGFGGEIDLDKARKYFSLAIEHGCILAKLELGRSYGESDVRRWRLFAEGAALGDQVYFLLHFAEEVGLFDSGSGSASVVFLIGRTLRGNVTERTIFGSPDNFNALIGPAKQAISFCDFQCRAYRSAVHTWTLVGMQLGVVKDIRIVIGKLIWESREEAKYAMMK